jgi:hypothetical protein
MTEPSQADSKQGAVPAIINALHPDAKGFLSVVVVFLVFFAAILGFINMPSFIKTLFAPKDQCWEFREVQQKLWKLNKCTGETALVESKPMNSATTSTQQPQQQPASAAASR